MTVTRLPYRHEDEVALLRVAALYARLWPGWGRFIIGAAAAFHAALAVVLVTVPYGQLVTEGTAPVFALWPRYVWAGSFALAAVGLSVVLRWRKPVLHAVVWLWVTFLFGAWLTPLSVAVLDGGGSPVAVVVLLTVYALFFAGAVGNALRQR